MISSDAEGRAECQRFLATFRVTELKELLKTIGLSQKGRKSDLFQRANELLSRGSPKVQNRIREIYESSHAGVKRSLQYGRMAQRFSPMKSAQQRGHPGYIVHPDVSFKPHPFYHMIDSIIRPTGLLAMVSTGSSNSMKLHFHLTPHQVQQIYSSKNAAGDYRIQLLLRLGRQETSCEQEDFFPKQFYLKVNGHNCPTPGYYPHLSTRQDFKRIGFPINITNYVKTSAAEANEVLLAWGHDYLYQQGYCVAIELVRSLAASDLLQQLKARGVRSPDVSRALVREKLAVDRDSEISATSLRVSLLCPLGKLRMTHPCRSSACNHLQCFDASIYLQMNEKKARWVCPVCDKPAPLESLVIDGLFAEICEEASSTDIEFCADGQWRPITSKDTSSSVQSLLSSGGGGAEGGRGGSRGDHGSSPVTIGDTPENTTSRGEGTSANPILIDLTMSSDEEDEEEEPVARSQRKHSTASTASTISASSGPDFDDREQQPMRRHSRTEHFDGALQPGSPSYNPPTSGAGPHQRRRSHSENAACMARGSNAYSSSQPVSVITQGPVVPPVSFPMPSFSSSLLSDNQPYTAQVDDPLFRSLFPDDSFYSLFAQDLNSTNSIISLD